MVLEGKGSSLLALPAELRNRIYEYALTGPNGEVLVTKDDFAQPALLRVNQQLKAETTALWYKVNEFLIDTTDYDPAAIQAFSQHAKPYNKIIRKVAFSINTRPTSWSNLVKWLELVHNRSLITYFLAGTNSKSYEKAACAAFNIVIKMHDSPWNKVLEILEIHKQTVEEQHGARWKWT